jgi:hypothetical protein
MENSTGDSRRGQTACEECGQPGARPVEVAFWDENAVTLDLCESCVDEFENADLVETVALVDDESSDSSG